jgi:hypothetical protein
VNRIRKQNHIAIKTMPRQLGSTAAFLSRSLHAYLLNRLFTTLRLLTDAGKRNGTSLNLRDRIIAIK